MDLYTRIERARGELKKTRSEMQRTYALPTCIIEGLLASELAEIRGEIKLELIEEFNENLKGKDEELKRAKAAAKKVLPAGDQQDEEQPEE